MQGGNCLKVQVSATDYCPAAHRRRMGRMVRQRTLTDELATSHDRCSVTFIFYFNVASRAAPRVIFPVKPHKTLAQHSHARILYTTHGFSQSTALHAPATLCYTDARCTKTSRTSSWTMCGVWRRSFYVATKKRQIRRTNLKRVLFAVRRTSATGLQAIYVH